MCVFGLQLKIWKGFLKNVFLLKQLKIVKIDFLSNGATLESVQPTGWSWLAINSRPIWPWKKFFFDFFNWYDVKTLSKLKGKFFWKKFFFEKTYSFFSLFKFLTQVIFLSPLPFRVCFIWKSAVKTFCSRVCFFFTEKTMKNGGKNSFLAILNQKLHTGPLDAADQRRARLVPIWWSKIWAK